MRWVACRPGSFLPVASPHGSSTACSSTRCVAPLRLANSASSASLRSSPDPPPSPVASANYGRSNGEFVRMAREDEAVDDDPGDRNDQRDGARGRGRRCPSLRAWTGHGGMARTDATPVRKPQDGDTRNKGHRGCRVLRWRAIREMNRAKKLNLLTQPVPSANSVTPQSRVCGRARASFSVKIHRRVSHYRQCVLLLGRIIGLLRLRQAQ
jgi:hypothetical protein